MRRPNTASATFRLIFGKRPIARVSKARDDWFSIRIQSFVPGKAARCHLVIWLFKSIAGIRRMFPHCRMVTLVDVLREAHSVRMSREELDGEADCGPRVLYHAPIPERQQRPAIQYSLSAVLRRSTSYVHNIRLYCGNHTVCQTRGTFRLNITRHSA